MPSSLPLPGSCLPNAAISAADSSGSTDQTQAYSRSAST
jgi:hypothetical protein